MDGDVHLGAADVMWPAGVIGANVCYLWRMMGLFQVLFWITSSVKQQEFINLAVVRGKSVCKSLLHINHQALFFLLGV